MRRDPHRFRLGPQIAHEIDQLLEARLECLQVFLWNHVVVLVELDVTVVHPQKVPGAAIDLFGRVSADVPAALLRVAEESGLAWTKSGFMSGTASLNKREIRVSKSQGPPGNARRMIVIDSSFDSDVLANPIVRIMINHVYPEPKQMRPTIIMQMQHLEIQIRFRTDRTFPVDDHLLLIRKRTSLALHPEITAVIVIQMSADRISIYELKHSRRKSASEVIAAVQTRKTHDCLVDEFWKFLPITLFRCMPEPIQKVTGSTGTVGAFPHVFMIHESVALSSVYNPMVSEELRPGSEKSDVRITQLPPAQPLSQSSLKITPRDSTSVRR